MTWVLIPHELFPDHPLRVDPFLGLNPIEAFRERPPLSGSLFVYTGHPLGFLDESFLVDGDTAIFGRRNFGALYLYAIWNPAVWEHIQRIKTEWEASVNSPLKFVPFVPRTCDIMAP